MAERNGRDRRTEILKTVGELFLSEGYAGASMSRIASAVGGSKATLYAYFSGKEELFRSYMEMRVRQEAAELFVFPETEESPAATLTRFGVRFLEAATRDDSRALLRLLYAESPRFPELGKIFYELCLLNGRKRLTEYLRRLENEGALRLPDPELAAEQFLALCQAKISMELMLCVRRQISPEEGETVVRAAVSTFLAAYARPRNQGDSC